MKKMICVVCAFALFMVLAGCKNEEKLQEERRVEITRKLDVIHLLYGMDAPDWFIEKFDLVLLPDGEHYLDANKLAILLNLCVNDLKSENIEITVPTVEQILSLYDVYDEEITEQFNYFYDWRAVGWGNTGESLYERGMAKANELYEEKYGEPFFEGRSIYNIPAEKAFAFEDYIKENPDFEEEDLAYISILEWVGAIRRR